MSNLFWLTDAQMARLQPFFPKSHGKPCIDDRRVLSGIIFINRNGLRWRDAPKEYGPPKMRGGQENKKAADGGEWAKARRSSGPTNGSSWPAPRAGLFNFFLCPISVSGIEAGATIVTHRNNANFI